MAKLRRGVEDKVLDKQAMALVDSLPDNFSQMDMLKFSETLADNRDLLLGVSLITKSIARRAFRINFAIPLKTQNF